MTNGTDKPSALHSSNTIPKWSDLPVDKNGPWLNAWGLYGKDDELGTLNRLTPEIVKAAAASEIQTGVGLSIDWPLDAQGDMVLYDRQAFHKKVWQKSPRIVNDDVWTFNTQRSSQWHGLLHFGYQKEAVFYNGITLDDIYGTPTVEKKHLKGISAWSEKSIVGRGILLDYEAWQLKHGRVHSAFTTQSISAADLKAVAADQGTEIKFGDILLIRSGWMSEYYRMSMAERAAANSKRPATAIGVEQSEDMLEFLWTNFSAAGGDSGVWEAWPSQKNYYLHEVMLGGWGMPIGEFFDLEPLAKHCREIGRWSFYFVSEPNNVPGGVASPPNGLAMF